MTRSLPLLRHALKFSVTSFPRLEAAGGTALSVRWENGKMFRDYDYPALKNLGI